MILHAPDKELTQAKNQSPSLKRFLKVNLSLPKIKKTCGCAEFVNYHLVENYAQMIGEPVISFSVKASLDYLKQTSQLWYQIYQVRLNLRLKIQST